MAVRIGIVGAGKMGISHLAIANAHPRATVVAVCDTSKYVLSTLRKYARVSTYSRVSDLVADSRVDALMVATPTRTHFECARHALERNVHVFVEKPLTLSSAESKVLADLAAQRGRVGQVGYHNRFIGTFREARRLVGAGALGTVKAVRGSAFGPVVVKKHGGGATWRSFKAEGGGCLHDYACHVVDLMNFVVGPPAAVTSARLESIFSEGVEDVVHASFAYASGATGSLETNWSDERFRKMTTVIEVEGSAGRLTADRQEIRVELQAPFETYAAGKSVRYITGLQAPVAFYLRGEEYSAQLDAFVDAIAARGATLPESTFATAYETDRVIDLIQDAAGARGEARAS
jgi:predicted dehydrogenase